MKHDQVRHVHFFPSLFEIFEVQKGFLGEVRVLRVEQSSVVVSVNKATHYRVIRSIALVFSPLGLFPILLEIIYDL